MRLVACSGRIIESFGFCWHATAGSLRLLVAVRGEYSPWPNVDPLRPPALPDIEVRCSFRPEHCVFGSIDPPVGASSMWP